jgi:ParB family chromosome partitioning protein
MSKIVLGKGLDALISSESKKSNEQRRFRTLPLDSLAPNPMQPRRDFDDVGLHELADSIKENGVIQPLLVKQDGSAFTIIAGERRFRAAKLAGLTEVPVILMDEPQDVRMLELALVENVQREDLNAMEVAEAYRTLLQRCGLTQMQLADKVGKSRAAVANLLRLLTLPDKIKQMIREGKLSEGHARAILAIDSEEEMLRLADKIVAESLSVRVVEKHTSRGKKRRLTVKRRSPELVEAESYLKQLMGTSVKIIPGLKQGRIEIEYYNDDDLTRLLDLFRKMA